MRTWIVVEVSTADRARLEAVVPDWNSPQRHVWRAEIVLLTADGHGTNEIMRRKALCPRPFPGGDSELDLDRHRSAGVAERAAHLLPHGPPGVLRQRGQDLARGPAAPLERPVVGVEGGKDEGVRDSIDLHADEAGPGEKRAQQVGVAEGEGARGGLRDGGCVPRQEDVDAAVVGSLGRGQDRDGGASPRAQHAVELADPARGVGEEHEPEAAQQGVEAAVW